MEYTVFLLRIFVSFFLSLIIGLERQWGRHAIGLRTNVLVCIGAFLFVAFSVQIKANDLTRIAAQVVSGIGFLGAGIIIKDGTNIRGLNTAATLWCNAAIGILCAGGFIVEAAIGTLFILFSNIVLRFLTNKSFKKKNVTTDYMFKITCDDDKELRVRNIISKLAKNINVSLKNIESKEIEGGKVKIYAVISTDMALINVVDKFMNNIMNEPGVR